MSNDIQDRYDVQIIYGITDMLHLIEFLVGDCPLKMYKPCDIGNRRGPSNNLNDFSL